MGENLRFSPKFTLPCGRKSSGPKDRANSLNLRGSSRADLITTLWRTERWEIAPQGQFPASVRPNFTTGGQSSPLANFARRLIPPTPTLEYRAALCGAAGPGDEGQSAFRPTGQPGPVHLGNQATPLPKKNYRSAGPVKCPSLEPFPIVPVRPWRPPKAAREDRAPLLRVDWAPGWRTVTNLLDVVR